MVPNFQTEGPLEEHEFIQNEGQFTDYLGNQRSDVKFYASNTNPSVYVGDSSLSLIFNNQDEQTGLSDSAQEVVMSLSQSQTPYTILKAQESKNLYGFFLSWLADSLVDVRSYYMLESYDVYNGIDLIYYSNM